MLISNIKTYLIDVACVYVMDQKVKQFELQSLWNTTVEMVPLIFAALGSLSDSINIYLI